MFVNDDILVGWLVVVSVIVKACWKKLDDLNTL